MAVRAISVNELRETFLAYFEGRGHLRIPSSSLVPHGDPTLLFTTAGMVQFKPYFMGLAEPPAPRMTSVQKCFRTTDIEEVGDASHLTFFEMLGNFSVGDYFKPEAIEWAWDFLTNVLGIDPTRLWATVYIDDDEALELWAQRGIARDRILRYTAEQGNFWGPPGDSGPCGPCSELHFDFGATMGCRRCAEDTCHPDVGCGRFLEIWNLVFMAYFQDEDGTRTPLPAQNIDTGAGLERLAWVLQQGTSVYDTDELRTVVDAVAAIARRPYDPNEAPEVARALRSIAEHSRAIAFLIDDGVLPANEGRGYVLRRELRRALYFAHTIGLREPFLARAVDVAVEASSAHYPGLLEQRDFIRRIAATEEARFQATLTRGLELLDEVIAREHGSKRIPGRDMFALYDTHGLPPELTREVAAGLGFDVDEAGFEAEMAAQRDRSRGEQFAVDAESGRAGRYAALGLESRFEGYETVVVDSTVAAVLAEGSPTAHLETGQRGEIVLEATSFYPEGGGQVGDRGEIVTPTGRFHVDDTQRFGEVIVHFGAVLEGAIGARESARALVDREWRLGSQRNHTATHLLHAALRSVLGTHVRQAGSYVGPDRLRFDYTHPEAPSAEELRAVQRLVNAKVREDIRRETLELPYDAAIERGAIAFFEDRYTSTVRVVEYCDLPRSVRGEPSSVRGEPVEPHGEGHHEHEHGAHEAHEGHGGCFSRELCGGTHLPSTGPVGILQIASDSSIGAGLRRIEAVTGPEAERLIEERADLVGALSARFRVPPAEIPARIDALEEQLAEERRRLEQQRREASAGTADRLLEAAVEVAGVRVLGALVEAQSGDDLRSMADRLRRQLGSAVVVLGASIDGRPSLLAATTDDVVERGVRADELVRAGAELIGGRGGGRPQLAQAGGRDASRLAEAIEVARALASERLMNSGR